MNDSEGDSRYHLPAHQNGRPKVLTDQRKKRGDVVAVEGEKGGREFRSLDAPLEFYISRQIITGRQYRAGKRLHTLWLKSRPVGHVQVRYEEGDGGGPALSFVPPGFGAIEYREAMDSVKSLEAKEVVRSVCCEGIAASRCVEANSVRTAKRRGIMLLLEALDCLANHFKYD